MNIQFIKIKKKVEEEKIKGKKDEEGIKRNKI